MTFLRIDVVFLVLDFLGVFVGALGGAIDALSERRYRYDFIGVFGLAFVAALGGGIVRDVILQKGPPLAFLDIRYEITAFLGASIVLALRNRKLMTQAASAIVVTDAVAIGLFCVAGTTRALDAGLLSLPALLLGVTTAVGGGSLRDVVSGRAPKIFERGQFYAIAACFGSAVFLTCNHFGLPRPTSSAAGVLACSSLRLLSWRLNWRTSPIGAK